MTNDNGAPDLDAEWVQQLQQSQQLGAEILTRIREQFATHIYLKSDHHYDVLAVFCLWTYVYESRRLTPYILATSPVKGSGKSTLLELVAMHARRGFVEIDPAAVAIAHRIQDERGCLCLDEVDGIWSGTSNDKKQLRTILNAGYHHMGTISRRANGRTVRINVYSPKVLAGIEDFSIPETLRDRCIPLTLHKMTRDATKVFNRITNTTYDRAEIVTQLADLWASDYFDRVGFAQPQAPDHLYGRKWDLWEPLYIVAELCGGEWPDRIYEASLAMVDEDEDPKVALLRDIREAFGLKQWIKSDELIHYLNSLEDAPWGTIRSGERMTTHHLAKLLKPFGIKPELKNSGMDRGKRGYAKAQFEDVWQSYL